MSDVAERQMRAWAHRLDTQQRTSNQPIAESAAPSIQPYVVISREAGVDASELARAVAAKTGWSVLDRELLDSIAEKYHLSRDVLDFVDERAASWFQEVFGKWLDHDLVSQAEFVSCLGKIARLAAEHESTVFVGRAVQFMLPPELGTRVRIIAPRKQRVQRMMENRECSRKDAEKLVDGIDEGRAQFVRRYFHRDVNDARQFDLVINLEHISRKDAVDMIVWLCHRQRD